MNLISLCCVYANARSVCGVRSCCWVSAPNSVCQLWMRSAEWKMFISLCFVHKLKFNSRPTMCMFVPLRLRWQRVCVCVCVRRKKHIHNHHRWLCVCEQAAGHWTKYVCFYFYTYSRYVVVRCLLTSLYTERYVMRYDASIKSLAQPFFIFICNHAASQLKFIFAIRVSRCIARHILFLSFFLFFFFLLLHICIHFCVGFCVYRTQIERANSIAKMMTEINQLHCR